MLPPTHGRPRSVLAVVWRAAKIFLGAWAIAVACVIGTMTAAQLAFGPLAAEWLLDNRQYIVPSFFVLGLVVSLRWLK
jgi:hypothetical protein